MLVYDLNCWLMLFNPDEHAKLETVRLTIPATARLRLLFLPAKKICRHAGRVGVSYSNYYAEQGILRRLMDRLRAIARDGQRLRPVLATALTGCAGMHRPSCTQARQTNDIRRVRGKRWSRSWIQDGGRQLPDRSRCFNCDQQPRVVCIIQVMYNEAQMSEQRSIVVTLASALFTLGLLVGTLLAMSAQSLGQTVLAALFALFGGSLLALLEKLKPGDQVKVSAGVLAISVASCLACTRVSTSMTTSF